MTVFQCEGVQQKITAALLHFAHPSRWGVTMHRVDSMREGKVRRNY